MLIGVVIGLRLSGCNGVVAEYWTRDRQGTGQLSPALLQAMLSKLLTYFVLRPTQPPTLSGMGNEW